MERRFGRGRLTSASGAARTFETPSKAQPHACLRILSTTVRQVKLDSSLERK